MEKLIRFASDMSNTSLVENLIDEVSEKYHIGQEQYGNMLVTVIEAVINSIVHGNKLDPRKYVEVGYSVNSNVLKFVVSDQGEGFDFDTIPDPTVGDNLEKPNGRGVFLMTQLTDQLEFARNGAEVRLYFFLNK